MMNTQSLIIAARDRGRIAAAKMQPRFPALDNQLIRLLANISMLDVKSTQIIGAWLAGWDSQAYGVAA